MSFARRMQRAKTTAETAGRDPWHDIIAPYVAKIEAISTVALLDLMHARHNTGTARRLAPIMLALGFVPIRSRKLYPGGFRDTVCRGWTRPFRNSREHGRVQSRTKQFMDVSRGSEMPQTAESQS